MATVFQKCVTDPASPNYPCPKGGNRCKHPYTVQYREPGGRQGRQREKSFPKKQQATDYGIKMEDAKRAASTATPRRARSRSGSTRLAGWISMTWWSPHCGCTGGSAPTT